MVLGADGAYYPDAQSAAAGALAVSQGVLSVNPGDNESAIFGNSPLPNTSVSALPSIGSTGSIGSWLSGIVSQAQNFLNANPSSAPEDFAEPNLSGTNTSPVGSAIASATSAVSSVGSFLTAISNPARDATVILGLILIIAGVFALSKGPAVNIVSSAVRGAVTS